MIKINYITGDLFSFIPEDKPIVVAHIVNDVGAFGGGFVVPLGKRFPAVKSQYLHWHRGTDATMAGVPLMLGHNQVVYVDERITVCNMVAQHGLISPSNPHPIDYSALRSCMEVVADVANIEQAEIHAPKFGSLRSGGDWSVIEKLIEEIWIEAGISVTIYSLENPI
jgi:hypothetical protein